MNPADTPVDEARLRGVCGGDVTFDKIFEAAKIAAPAHGFTVGKVSEMLNHPKLAGLAKEAKAAAILVALEAQGVKIEAVLAEAINKDRALDVFDKVQRQHAAQFAQQKEGENQKLTAQIEANDRAVADLQAKIEAWARKKALKEQEFYDIVGHFTTDNPVTLSAARPAPQDPPQPGPKVKVTDLTQSFGQ